MPERCVHVPWLIAGSPFHHYNSRSFQMHIGLFTRSGKLSVLLIVVLPWFPTIHIIHTEASVYAVSRWSQHHLAILVLSFHCKHHYTMAGAKKKLLSGSLRCSPPPVLHGGRVWHFWHMWRSNMGMWCTVDIKDYAMTQCNVQHMIININEQTAINLKNITWVGLFLLCSCHTMFLLMLICPVFV